MNESTKCTETWKYLRLPHIPNKGNEHRAAVKHSLRKCSLHIYMEGMCEYTVTVSHLPVSEGRKNYNS